MSRKSDECLSEIENSRAQLIEDTTLEKIEDYILELENDLEEALDTIKDLESEVDQLKAEVIKLENNKTE